MPWATCLEALEVAASETPGSRFGSPLLTLTRMLQRLSKTIPDSKPQTGSDRLADQSASGGTAAEPAGQARYTPAFGEHVAPNLKPVNLHGHEPLINLPDHPGIPAPVGQRARRSIPQDIKIAVSVRDGGRCRQCGATHQLHFDHVIPVSRGGANTPANIQLLCGSCNRAKSAKLKPGQGV